MTATIATMSVSVLNTSYEPLGSTRLGRALALVNSGKAVIEEADNRVIRTVGGLQIPFPKVIRLLSYINVPFVYSEEYWSRSGVIRRDNSTCGYCSTKKGKLTVDHIIPRSKNGQDTWANTICACQKCNSLKADKLLEDTNLVLQFEPTIPMRIFLKSGKKPRKKTK